MNRKEFMKTLAQGINTLPDEEFHDAINYYNEYFDEADAKKEKKVIKELGDPTKIAAQIMDDYREKQENEKIETEPTTSLPKDRSWIWILFICLSPILVPLAFVFVLLLFVVIIMIFAFFFALYVLVVALFLSGLFSLGIGIITLFTHVPTGIFTIGAGFLLISLGLLLFIPINTLTMITMKGIVKCQRSLFRKGKKHEKRI